MLQAVISVFYKIYALWYASLTTLSWACESITMQQQNTYIYSVKTSIRKTFCSHFFIRVCCGVSSLALFLLFLISVMVSSMNSICEDYPVNNFSDSKYRQWKKRIHSSILMEAYSFATAIWSISRGGLQLICPILNTQHKTFHSSMVLTS